MSPAATQLKGDDRVNMVLDCKISRKSQYTRKYSVTIQAEEIFQSARNMNTVSGEIPGTTPGNIKLFQMLVYLSFLLHFQKLPNNVQYE